MKTMLIHAGFRRRIRKKEIESNFGYIGWKEAIKMARGLSISFLRILLLKLRAPHRTPGKTSPFQSPFYGFSF